MYISNHSLQGDVFFFNSIINDTVGFDPGFIGRRVQFKNSLVRYGSHNFYAGADWGGNIDTIPGFVAPGDYRLQSGSAAINAGLNDSIPLDLVDLDNDGNVSELIPYDLYGNMRVVDGRVDMGAYEYMPAWSDTIHDAMCGGDSVIFNGHTISEGGVHKHAYTQDSAQYLTLKIDSPNVDVQVWFNGILEAKADSVSYHWINCNDTSINYGVTTKTFYPSQPGDYAVIITTPEGCVDTSACYNVYAIGMQEQLDLNSSIKLYPNPSSGKVNISLENFELNQEVMISTMNLNGRKCLSDIETLYKGEPLELDMKTLPQGIYIVQVNEEFFRIVRE